MRGWFGNVIQALDRLINAIFGGSDREYLSSRVYRYKDVSKVAFCVYWVLNKIEANHCETAYANDQKGFDPSDAVLK